MSAPAFATFWTGPLNATAYSCLASFPARGALLALYSYDNEAEAPSGVEPRDARDICPDANLMQRYLVDGKPSAATFSDRFRYEMLASTELCWVDADILCQHPKMLRNASRIWGRQPEAHGKALINNAILRLPAHDPVLGAMLERARGAEGENIGWGAIGPFLLTEIAELEGVYSTSHEPGAFYPIAPDEFWRLLDPSFCADTEAVARDAIFVHLWSELLRRVGYDFDAAPPTGSYLYERFGEIGTLPRFRRTCESAEIAALIARCNATAAPD